MPEMNAPGVPGFFGGARFPDLDVASSRGHSSEEFWWAFEDLSHGEVYPQAYYNIQGLQSLGKERNQVRVPIWIAGQCNSSSEFLSLGPVWTKHIHQAIRNINRAAPGLLLYNVPDRSQAKVTIASTDTAESCYSVGNILWNPTAKIYLCRKWNEKDRTSCHELLHALGFGHEHQRRDRDHAMDVESDNSQYRKINELCGMTRFDPFSIMLYPEEEDLLRRSGDPVWFTKPHKELNREMSDLDKVSLNNLYRPCEGPTYSPAKGITGLYYCGRYFGVQDIYPEYHGYIHDGFCGPTNGPNCPACRVLKTDRVMSLWRKDKWQGWTGQAYCGRYFGVQVDGHNGYCGPNNGPQCPECFDELLRGY